MKTFIIVVVALLAIAEAKRAGRTARSAVGFQQMINYATGRSALDFYGYGCWCGLGPYIQNPTPVDQLDACCKAHDNCYSDTGCNILQWEVVNPYNWYKHPVTGAITCSDSPGTCDRENCECDRIAANCFAAAPYNDKYSNYLNLIHCW